MAVYDPALMMQSEGLSGSALWLAVAYIVFKAALAVGFWGAASIGYLRAAMPWWERIVVTTAAGFLVLALPVIDEIGFGLAILVIAARFWRTRQSAIPAGA